MFCAESHVTLNLLENLAKTDHFGEQRENSLLCLVERTLTTKAHEHNVIESELPYALSQDLEVCRAMYTLR